MSEKNQLNLIFKAILALNEKLGANHFVSYRYEEDGTHAIVHNFYDKLFKDDEFAAWIGSILHIHLTEKGFSNWEFYAI